MSPEEALKVVTEATAVINAPRAQHIVILQALEVLKKAIVPAVNNVQALSSK